MAWPLRDFFGGESGEKKSKRGGGKGRAIKEKRGYLKINFFAFVSCCEIFVAYLRVY